MYSLIVLLLLSVVWHAQQPNTGRLVLVVRDEHGMPIAGVRLGIYRDADDGRQEIGEYMTDAAGQVVLEDLAWGVYIVQFRGSLPGGPSIQPADQQNAGLLDDGNGVANGFGVRFASPERTELFVLAHSAAEALAVPLFDMVPNMSVSPQPMNPLGDAGVPDVPGNDPQPIDPASVQLPLPSANVGTATPSPQTTATVVAGQGHVVRSRIGLFCLVPVVVVCVMVGAGWLHAARAEQQHAR